MSEPAKGQVVTFYSYKGGTGRTMALANVAWILAAAGKRVLVADWDLESPGLHRFYRPFLDVDTIASTGGVIDMIREFEEEVKREVAVRPADWVREFAKIERYAFSLNWIFPDGGTLDFLSAGRQNDFYAAALGGLDWENFYDRLEGRSFLDAIRQEMIKHYDYCLIDSRTGFSDVSDICTGHLPDTLVDCFTLSDQGISGASQIATNVRNHKVRNEDHHIRVLPVAMRVDPGEKDKADAGRALALRSFPGLPAGMEEVERIQYFDRVEVPYRTYYAYEETLATFADRPGSANSLLVAYEQLTQVITQGEVKAFRPMEEAIRTRVERQFKRQLEEVPATIVLEYAAEDQAWAEWVTHILLNAGVGVIDHGPIGRAQPDQVTSKTSRTLAVISAKYVELRRGVPREVQWEESAPLRIYISDVAGQQREAAVGVSMVGLSASEASAQLLQLMGELSGARQHHQTVTVSVRFPGAEPEWFRAPARNPRFTGRLEDLYRLRRELRSGSEAVALIALQGMGGVGKTQLALEYVYRFRTSYDLVWWIAADPPQFIDTALTDLANTIGIPAERTAVESARSVLAALRQGKPADRWLLIFDNADDLSLVEPFLPQGGHGHLLITSRNAEWGNRAQAIAVDVFQRTESVAHLRARVPSLTGDQANQLAEELADLPIAVAVAGAWLAETGTPVDKYLRDIQRDGVAALSLEAVWGFSLERLQKRSPAAYRLLQLCSVMATETALELLYSDEMAAHLIKYDPSVSDRLMRGSLIQQINRLALLKLDVHAGQAQVHRLLQDVVRRRMSQEEIALAKHQAHLVLAKSRPSGEVEDPLTWPRFRSLWPHLEVSGAGGCSDESVRQLLIDRVRYLWRRGDLERGEDFGNEIAGQWQRLLEENEQGETANEWDSGTLRRQLLLLRFNIANILRDRGRFEEALKLDEEILGQQRELLGSRHSHTLMTSGSRAADLRALGRYAESIPLDRETHRSWSEEFGEDHPRTLSAANNLATSLRSMGEFRQAEIIDNQVWKLRRYVLGEAHPYTLASASALGRDLREAGRYGDSVNLLRGLLVTARSELGAEATYTLNIQSNLAASLRSAGRSEEAAPLLEEAFQAFRARFDRDHPDALACRLNRAANLLARGNTELALREITTVTGEYITSLGESHPLTLVCISDQAAAYRVKGDHKAAYSLITRAATGCLEALGASHPYSLATAMNLAICEYDAGSREAALERTQELVELMGTALGMRHPDTLTAKVSAEIMASKLQHLGPASRGGGSDPVDSLAFNALVSTLGSEHPTVADLRAAWLVCRVIDPHDPF